jgi:hypothetical protein
MPIDVTEKFPDVCILRVNVFRYTDYYHEFKSETR